MTPDRQPGRHCATQGPPANAMVETMKDKPRHSRIDAAAEGPPFGMVPSFPKACYIGPMPIPRHPEIIFDHPPTSPDSFPAPLDYLIDVPSCMASNAHFRDFIAETLLPMMAARPEDPNLPAILACLAAALAWRQTVPPEDRFWKRDPASA